MQITIDINESAKKELVKSFGVSDVKEAVEALISRYVDRYSQEREIGNNVLHGIKEVKEGKTKDIKELFDAI